VARADYEQLGAKLRDVRLKRRLNLREVAQRLHVRRRYLEAIEEGDPSKLPGAAYARGYVRAYAEMLEMDVSEVLDAYARAGSFPQKRFFHFPEHLNRAREPSNMLVGLTLCGFAALTLALALAPARSRGNGASGLISGTRAEARPALPSACLDALAPAYPPCYGGESSLGYAAWPPGMEGMQGTGPWASPRKKLLDSP
jgi:cytoskeleton protein RodZ